MIVSQTHLASQAREIMDRQSFVVSTRVNTVRMQTNLSQIIRFIQCLFYSVIVDASDLCNVASFDIGGGTSTRQWDIKGEKLASFNLNRYLDFVFSSSDTV